MHKYVKIYFLLSHPDLTPPGRRAISGGYEESFY